MPTQKQRSPRIGAANPSRLISQIAARTPWQMGFSRRWYRGLGMTLVASALLLPLSGTLAMPTPAEVDTSGNRAEPDPAPLQSDCQPTASEQFFPLATLVSNLAQTAAWAGEPTIAIETLAGNLGPQLSAYLAATPWPGINDRAKLARVPVMMYHDIRPDKKVFFDVTPEEFEAHLKLIQDKGLTPITLDQLVTHLQTGLPLPEKPILLTFDDGYEGHYRYVYPLLKKYNYPAVFSIYTKKVDTTAGRPGVTWEELREMAKDPLITIASHSVSHSIMPPLADSQLQQELVESKRILESQLGIPIHYFTYPEGKYDARVANAVKDAGYSAALTMDDADERLAGQSESLLAIGRIGQSRTKEMVNLAWGGPKLPSWNPGFDFTAPIEKVKTTIDNTPFIFISGGRPITIHHKTRGQVPEILAGTEAVAAVDGGFFSLEFLDSNTMIGPVYSTSTGQFIPGRDWEIARIKDRPLVLISPTAVRYIPFDPAKHNTLEGLQAEMPDVTDAFVAAAWLVKDSQPRPYNSFGKLFDFNAARHRAFWGINQSGQPMIGVSTEPIGSVDLGAALAKAGFREAVMLDSGASTSLAYKGQSLVGYTPRPVPHVVALLPSNTTANRSTCVVAQRDSQF